jgi:hypothetical protein
MAQESDAKLALVMKVLDSASVKVQADIMELEELKVVIPIGVSTYHSAAVREHVLARDAIEFGNVEAAEFHAMQAMEFFRMVTDLLAGVEELKSTAVIEGAVEESMARLDKRASYLESLASASDVSISYSDYHDAIAAGKSALANDDHKAAEQKLAHAESIITDIQDKIQKFADSKKQEKAEKFAEKVITRLAKMVSEQEKQNHFGERDSLIDKLRDIASDLKDAKNIDEIMQATDDASSLQTVIRDYKALLSESDKTEEVDRDDDDEKEEDEHEDSDNSGSGSGSSGDDDSDDDNSGSGSSGSGNGGEQHEEDILKEEADELEDRAEALLDGSNNPIADLKIEEALALIDTAKDLIDDANYAVARTTLASAETLLDIAEALI